MKTHIPILLVLLGLVLPAIAGNSDEILRKNLAQLDQLIKANTINLKELHAKRSTILKKLGGAKPKQSAEYRKRVEAKRQAALTKKTVPNAAKKKAEYAKKNAAAIKAKKAEYAKKKAAAAKKPGTKKPGTKKPGTKKPGTKKKPAKTTKGDKGSKSDGDLHKKAEAARAKFLKRFDANRDGKVTKDEAKSVLASEAKKREGDRKKK
jgi:hypothetical protein